MHRFICVQRFWGWLWLYYFSQREAGIRELLLPGTLL
jgi:hypothetical protein